MAVMLTIALITVALFLLSVVFFPSVGKKRKIKIYSLLPLAGAVLMIAVGDITWGDVFVSFTENTSVNPIKILVLFLSMTVYSLILDKTGFFRYVSGLVLKKSGHDQRIVFLSLYAVISVLTVFTSNDIVILTFTPFICSFCHAARIDVIPYLIMEFVAANTWSLLLLIGNPTNIYISGAFGISFAEYFLHMALPTLAAGFTSLTVMLLLFGKRLKTQIDTQAEIEKVNDKPLMAVALVHLIACIVFLAISQYLSLEMWLISLCVGVSAVVCSVAVLLVRKKSLSPVIRALGGMPFEIIPFVIGMFIIVMGLDSTGITDILAGFIGIGDGILSYGISALLSSNLLNNIPMSVLFSKILAVEPSMPSVYATIAGSNIGAFLTPVGALAGIMWSNLIRENNVKLSVGKFISYGSVIGIPTMLASLAVIMLTSH